MKQMQKHLKVYQSDTQSLGLNIEKKLNDNILLLSLSSDLDLKNNYSPFSQTFKLSLFDECSKIRYYHILMKDLMITIIQQPSETINISFYMDYLGFFGYEQKK